MQTAIRLLFICCCLMYSLIAPAASENHVPLKQIKIDLRDHEALQRGARLYMNYCAGCHSLKYMRYNRLAKDIGIVDDDGLVANDLLRENLIFTTAKVGEHVRSAIPAVDAREWFGVAPPDLTLVSRVRGANWLYTYLTSFYQDKSRPFGTNNWLFPDVAMPNVLEPLQGEQVADFVEKTIPYNGTTKTIEVIEHLQLLSPGSMNQHQFDSAIHDLVTFLVYVGEPVRLTRETMGFWVILFLIILFGLAYALKKEYWKDIKKG